MGINFSFTGIPGDKITRLKNAFYLVVGRENANEVTEKDIEDWFKLQAKKIVQESERNAGVAQAEQDFNNNWQDPF